jgi:hypothetical protein
VQSHFAACFQPPQAADGSQITFYFSLKSDGEIYGEPRINWLGFKGSADDRKLLMPEFLNAFEHCLPLQLSEDMAKTIPGKVYYLQFRVGEGSKGTQVMLRPYGSMGYPLVHRHW